MKTLISTAVAMLLASTIGAVPHATGLHPKISNLAENGAPNGLSQATTEVKEYITGCAKYQADDTSICETCLPNSILANEGRACICTFEEYSYQLEYKGDTCNIFFFNNLRLAQIAYTEHYCSTSLYFALISDDPTDQSNIMDSVTCVASPLKGAYLTLYSVLGLSSKYCEEFDKERLFFFLKSNLVIQKCTLDDPFLYALYKKENSFTGTTDTDINATP
jgi:hypothetical protein